MATIKDVAEKAGVSVGTVSKVLRNVYVRPENRRRVEEAIELLNYQVNTYAQGLRASQTYTIAIIVPDLINPFFALLVNYVEQVLAAIGYRLFVCNSHCNAGRELSYINMVRRNKVDGLIAVTYSNSTEYENADFPLVSIDRHYAGESCCVASDNAMGGELAARKFIDTGCRSVIYIHNGSLLEGETLKRGHTFLNTCRQAGIRSTEIHFSEETTLDNVRIRQIEQFISQSTRDGRCDYDGIFASSDVHAMVIRRQLERLGLKVPEDLQVIGYDGMRVMNVGGYYVSTIVQPVKEMALACVDNLIRRIENRPYERSVILPVRFVGGGTTKGDPDQPDPEAEADLTW